MCAKSKSPDGRIGIVGGVGPYAGLDLTRKIFDNTIASCDQDHLPVVLLSLPSLIADRTDFLLGKTEENPGEVLGDIMVALTQLGADVIGMPCNTAHSPKILHTALDRLHCCKKNVKFVSLIDSALDEVAKVVGKGMRVGFLSTQGTYVARIYQDALSQAGFIPLFPDDAGRERVQSAISDPAFGIKSKSNPVTEQAKQFLTEEAQTLISQGAEAVILGCTEIPLALTCERLQGVPLIDATNALARSLIFAVDPSKLKQQ